MRLVTADETCIVLLPEEYLKGLCELVKSGVFPSVHGLHVEKGTIESREECKTPKETNKGFRMLLFSLL